MAKSNRMRAIFFETPDYIPMGFHINPSCWHHYPQDALLDLMEAHPFLFPNFQRPKTPFVPEYARCALKDSPYTDDFGCVWQTSDDGIVGVVTGHPLADWAAWEGYQMPDPAVSMGLEPICWQDVEAQVQRSKLQGWDTSGGLRHGHTFLQLCDLRGYDRLLFDMADEEPRLDQLIEQLEAFNQSIIDRYIKMGVDMIAFPEDLGMQVGPMISPALFRRYIQPSYRRMMQSVRAKNIPVHMHSDGDIRVLADDLIESGVVVINLQDLVNGIDWIRARFAGRICIELDIDRQLITAQGTPAQIDALIRQEVEALSTKAGGLMMIYGMYPGVPLENVAALMDAMERYAHYHS